MRSYLPYGELVKFIDAIACSFQDRGESVVGKPWPGGTDHPLTVYTFTNPDGYSMLRFRQPGHPGDSVHLEIAGGGGAGALPEADLFVHLFRRSQRFDWGGPFAAEHPNGTITYGSRITLPSSLINRDDPGDAGSFIMAMIDLMGKAARTLAAEAIPLSGGTLLNGSDPQHQILLLAALMGPMPPDLIGNPRPSDGQRNLNPTRRTENAVLLAPRAGELVDQFLSSDGSMEVIFEAGQAIRSLSIGPAADETLHDHSGSDASWDLLYQVARHAKAGGNDAAASKTALACFMWNHMVLPEDQYMLRALGEAADRLQAQIYGVGLGSALRLDLNMRLAGGRGGDLSVEDARRKAATGIDLMRDRGVPIRQEVYEAARPWIIPNWPRRPRFS